MLAQQTVDILCSSRELFGADRSALRLAGVLKTLGLHVTLVVPSNRPERGLSAEATERGVSVRTEDLLIASSRGFTRGRVRLPTYSTRPDIAITNTLAVASRPPGDIKRVVMVREWLTRWSAPHALLASWHALGAHRVVAVSNGVATRWASSALGGPSPSVVPNWLDDEVLRGAQQSARESTTRNGVLFIGRFNQWKGQELLGRAYIEAFSHGGDAPRITFLGAQPGTEFERFATALTELGQGRNWLVAPFTRNPTPHLASASLVVVPSLHPEPFGTVLLEALAFGCRVVAFPGGGPDDLVRHFPALRVVPRSQSALASALKAWWTSGGSSQTSGEFAATHSVLAARYSPQAARALWTDVLRDA